MPFSQKRRRPIVLSTGDDRGRGPRSPEAKRIRIAGVSPTAGAEPYIRQYREAMSQMSSIVPVSDTLWRDISTHRRATMAAPVASVVAHRGYGWPLEDIAHDTRKVSAVAMRYSMTPPYDAMYDNLTLAPSERVTAASPWPTARSSKTGEVKSAVTIAPLPKLDEADTTSPAPDVAGAVATPTVVAPAAATPTVSVLPNFRKIKSLFGVTRFSYHTLFPKFKALFLTIPPQLKTIPDASLNRMENPTVIDWLKDACTNTSHCLHIFNLGDDGSGKSAVGSVTLGKGTKISWILNDMFYGCDIDKACFGNSKVVYRRCNVLVRLAFDSGGAPIWDQFPATPLVTIAIINDDDYKAVSDDVSLCCRFLVGDATIDTAKYGNLIKTIFPSYNADTDKQFATSYQKSLAAIFKIPTDRLKAAHDTAAEIGVGMIKIHTVKNVLDIGTLVRNFAIQWLTVVGIAAASGATHDMNGVPCAESIVRTICIAFDQKVIQSLSIMRAVNILTGSTVKIIPKGIHAEAPSTTGYASMPSAEFDLFV